MLFDHAARDPDGLAVDDLSSTRTWAQLEDRVTRLTRLLREHYRLEPGDHIAVLMENRAEFLEVVLSAILAGVWVTPINWHLRADEVRYIVADSGARVVFSSPTYVELAKQATDVELVVVGARLDTLLESVSAGPVSLDGPPGSTMIYTSGTTGRPKGVKPARAATVRDAFAMMERTGDRLGLDGRGPHLLAGPMYHAAPLMFSLYDLQNGASVVIMDKWTASGCLRLLLERGVRHTHLVPTMFVRMLRLPDEERRKLDDSPLELVLHGAAPVAVGVKQRMIEWVGPILVEYWGATEGGVYTTCDSAAWLERPGTVGKPIPSYEVFAGGEDGHRLPPGEVGSLYCRNLISPQAFRYHNAPEKTDAAYLEPAVFTAGDRGYVDDDGFVFITGRTLSMIISGGVNIYPAEIESVLQEHPAVLDVGVYGVPDAEWGEQVRAAVQLDADASAGPDLEEELRRFARQKLASYKVPRHIKFESQLPRDLNGKLYVGRLRSP